VDKLDRTGGTAMTDAVMLTENALRSVASNIEIYYKKKAPNGSWCIATCQNAAEQFASMREKLERLQAENAQLQAERDAAVEDLNIMALAMRESEELSENCCFACAYDGQNLPDNVILAYGECPGYDTSDCFKWRGAKAKEESENARYV
jgi:hypothetical protein